MAAFPKFELRGTPEAPATRSAEGIEPTWALGATERGECTIVVPVVDLRVSQSKADVFGVPSSQRDESSKPVKVGIDVANMYI